MKPEQPQLPLFEKPDVPVEPFDSAAFAVRVAAAADTPEHDLTIMKTYNKEATRLGLITMADVAVQEVDVVDPEKDKDARVPMPEAVRQQFADVAARTEPVKLGATSRKKADRDFFDTYWTTQARKNR